MTRIALVVGSDDGVLERARENSYPWAARTDSQLNWPSALSALVVHLCNSRMPKGFLAVFSEPGDVDLDEFQDWYNNEHVPLRLNHIPAFLTGARYQAADGRKPGWIALYDIDSTATFSNPSYTRLREKRSPREAALVKRLDTLDRRTCEVIFETGNKQTDYSSTGLAMGDPTQWIVTHGLDFDEMYENSEGLEKGWRTITTVGMAMKGVLRSKLFRCIDGSKSGVTVSPDPEAQRYPRYLVMHELHSEEDAESLLRELKQLSDTVLTISEEREWKLYRAYPCVAQGNLP